MALDPTEANSRAAIRSFMKSGQWGGSESSKQGDLNREVYSIPEASTAQEVPEPQCLNSFVSLYLQIFLDNRSLYS
jgi:hypothetical protein